VQDTVDERVAQAREYLAAARQRDINYLPPSRMQAELAETRRQLAQILAAYAERPALAPGQQGQVSIVRAFCSAAREGRLELAAHLETSAEVDSFYPIAYGAAVAHIDALLGVIDGLTGGER
jgi:hypothetical protein